MFSAPLTVTKVKNGTWKVEVPFSYKRPNGDIISIPQGFETDFASVPRGLWNLFPKDGQYAQAAVVHDFLYQKRGNVPPHKYKRKDCDKTFLEGMKDLKVKWLTRRLMYRAVRLFGWGPY